MPPTYVGVEGGERHLKAEAKLADLGLFKNAATELANLGFIAEDRNSAMVLAHLSNIGFFTGGGVLIGTRAFNAVINGLGFRPTTTERTNDIDLVRSKTLRLASTNDDFKTTLSRSGLDFQGVPELRPGAEPTSWFAGNKNQRIRVDLLAPLTGGKPFAKVNVPELNAAATGLHSLPYLLEETRPGLVIGKTHLIPVVLPIAERLFWHKLVLAQDRRTDDAAKAAKDRAQAACLLVALEDDAGELTASWEAMTPTMKKKASESWARLAPQPGAGSELVGTLLAEVASPKKNNGATAKKAATPSPKGGR
jgi:hypothetical protein